MGESCEWCPTPHSMCGCGGPTPLGRGTAGDPRVPTYNPCGAGAVPGQVCVGAGPTHLSQANTSTSGSLPGQAAQHCSLLFATQVRLCEPRPQTCLVSKLLPSAAPAALAQKACSLTPCVISPPHHHQEETRSPKPETDEMNEVETASIPQEKHVWIQPRVTRPMKPKGTATVSYMSEWAEAS